MPRRILKLYSILSAFVLCGGLLYASAASAELAPQSSRAGGVSISVQPVDVSAAATTWKFKVVLDTHSGSLGDDLARTATLLDGTGKPHAALGWEGDPAGGHHRSGVLTFQAPSPPPEGLELRIVRRGEAAPRVFRWSLK